MKVLGVITARGGSKGIPRKNIALLRGKPLLAYTAEAALSAKLLTRTVLSTEDDEIARVGRECGLEVPFLRPEELARDDTPTILVLQDVVRRLEAAGEFYDAVLILQPTSPLRQPQDIDGAIDLLERTGADSVISFVEAGGFHLARIKLVSLEGKVIDLPFADQVEEFEGQRRQDRVKLYRRDGSIYLTRRVVLMEENSVKGRDCRAWIVSAERAADIDTPFDFFLAEQLLKHQAGDRLNHTFETSRPRLKSPATKMLFFSK
jgi:CMP-N-acetylneuraminic acid synthetase